MNAPLTPERADPFVTSHPEVKAFWDATAEGRFVLPYCNACGRTHWYPRAVCPHCAAEGMDWRPAKGTGTIYTFSVMRHAQSPYVMAYVTLDEGPTMMTNIVDCDPEKIAIGQRVKVRLGSAPEGRRVPFFTPE
jgi:uncharacterized OB-fold protein